MLRSFCGAIRCLPPGPHKIDLSVSLCYNHVTMNYYALGLGSNPLGKWEKTPLPNHVLQAPYEKPEVMVCSGPVAMGSFVIRGVSDTRISALLLELDRTPPPEVYTEQDAEKIRRIARVRSRCEVRTQKVGQ